MRQCLHIVVFWIMTPCGLVGENVIPPCRLKVTHCHDREYHSIITPSYCHLGRVISCHCVIMFFRFKVELIPYFCMFLQHSSMFNLHILFVPSSFRIPWMWSLWQSSISIYLCSQSYICTFFLPCLFCITFFLTCYPHLDLGRPLGCITSNYISGPVFIHS
jgi:hypothetical protein